MIILLFKTYKSSQRDYIPDSTACCAQSKTLKSTQGMFAISKAFPAFPGLTSQVFFIHDGGVVFPSLYLSQDRVQTRPRLGAHRREWAQRSEEAALCSLVSSAARVTVGAKGLPQELFGLT